MVLYKRRHHKYLETSLSFVYKKCKKKKWKIAKKKRRKQETKNNKITNWAISRVPLYCHIPNVYTVYEYIVFLKARDRTASFSLQQVSLALSADLALSLFLSLSHTLSTCLEYHWSSLECQTSVEQLYMVSHWVRPSSGDARDGCVFKAAKLQ